MKSWNKKKPSVLTELASGEFAININTIPCKAIRNGVEVGGFESERLDFRAEEMSSDVIISRFIRNKISQSEELSLINAYQASVAGICIDEKKEKEYVDFLLWRQSMRETIKKTLEENKQILTEITEKDGNRIK